MKIHVYAMGLFVFMGCPGLAAAQSEQGSAKSSIMVQSLVCHTDQGSSEIDGILVNFLGEPIRNLEVEAVFRSQDGRFLSSDSFPVQYNPIEQGADSPFKGADLDAQNASFVMVTAFTINGPSLPTSGTTKVACQQN